MRKKRRFTSAQLDRIGITLFLLGITILTVFSRINPKNEWWTLLLLLVPILIVTALVLKLLAGRK